MPTRRRERRRRLLRVALEAGRLLEMRSTRIVLSVAIIASLLPSKLQSVAPVELGFLLLFAVEFVARGLALWGEAQDLGDDGLDEVSPPASWRSRLSAATFLLLDLAALASFVPGVLGLTGARWLRVFRLIRIVLLVGYWAPLVRDLRTILLRKERSRQLVLMGFAVALISFAGTVVLDHLAPTDVDFDSDGALTDQDHGFVVRLWWAFRQVQDPGNMLGDPSDATAVGVSLLLTVCGLFLVSFLIGMGTDVVRELMQISANRPPGMRGHTVVVGVSPATGPLLRELMAHYHKSMLTPKFALLGEDPERPAFLHVPALSPVVYRHAELGEQAFAERVDIAHAKRVLVLADRRRPDPDSWTVGLVLAIREATAGALLVAEVLDHSNAGAARVAGGPHTVVVPSEKLLGLYLSGVTREPGLDDVLAQLLTSRRQEIYSYIYGSDRLGSDRLTTDLPPFDALFERGVSSRDAAPVVPVGLICAPGGDGNLAEVRPQVLLNPDPAELARARAEGHIPCGFLALAGSFADVAEFAGRLATSTVGPPSEPPRAAPAFVGSSDRLPVRRVLMCGFRPASVSLCEALMLAHPEVQILMLVRDPPCRQRALDSLAERDTQVRLGLLREHGPRGRFERLTDGRMTYLPTGAQAGLGELDVRCGDWTTDRVLVELPGSYHHVGEMDLVFFVGAMSPAADGRTAMAVLKLAELQASQPMRFHHDFRVVATVSDRHLRQQLEARYQARVPGHTRIQVHSSQELRADFNFQSAAVPGFDALFSELLAPARQSVVRHVPVLSGAEDDGQPWTFGELARALRVRGHVLMGLERHDDAGEVMVGAAPVGRAEGGFALGELSAVWVMAPDTDGDGISADPSV